MKCGTYKTAAGSVVKISGKHCGIVEVSFDWVEEENACSDCMAEPYPADDELVWCCDYCPGGRAKLERVIDDKTE